MKIVSFILFIAISHLAFSQNITRSPLSAFGIGVMENNATASQSAMGGVKYAMASPFLMNYANPATYSLLKAPNFNAGLRVNSIQVKDEQKNTQRATVGYLKNMNLSFQLGKKLGIGVGLVPNSKVGYKYQEKQVIENYGAIDYLYQGEGGTNKVFFGAGYSFLQDSVNILAVGMNVAYIFGNMNYETRVIPDGSTSAYKTRRIESRDLSGMQLDYSLFYKRQIASNFSATIGAAYTLNNKFNSNHSKFIYSYTGTSNSETLKDTALYATSSEQIVMPSTLGVGVAFEFNRKKDQYHKSFILAFDYATTDWTKLSFNGTNQGLAKQDVIGIGFQYTPDGKAYKNIQKMIRYRIGARIENTQFVVKNTQVKDYGINFGIGIPIISAGVGTSFNIGMEIGKRGNTSSTVIQENYTNLNIGLSLTPARFDRWFKKSKIN